MEDKDALALIKGLISQRIDFILLVLGDLDCKNRLRKLMLRLFFPFFNINSNDQI